VLSVPLPGVGAVSATAAVVPALVMFLFWLAADTLETIKQRVNPLNNNVATVLERRISSVEILEGCICTLH
jgi:hypothetical protein